MILAMDGGLSQRLPEKNSFNTIIVGVGMLLSPCTPKSLNSIEKIQPIIILATFNGNLGMPIISC